MVGDVDRAALDHECRHRLVRGAGRTTSAMFHLPSGSAIEMEFGVLEFDLFDDELAAVELLLVVVEDGGGNDEQRGFGRRRPRRVIRMSATAMPPRIRMWAEPTWTSTPSNCSAGGR